MTLTLALVLAGALLGLERIRHRWVGTTALDIQTRYTAEAGLAWGLHKLASGPVAPGAWALPESLMVAPQLDSAAGQRVASVTCTLSVESFGGFRWLRAMAGRPGHQVEATALVAATPPPAFDAALLLGDPTARLTLAGNAAINGLVWTGPTAPEPRALQGRAFEGRSPSEVRLDPDVALPDFDTTEYMRWVEVAQYGPSDQRGNALSFAGRNWTRVVGTRVLGPDDWLRLNTDGAPIRLHVQGALTLTGPVMLAPGTVLAASGSIRLEGVRGRHVLVVAGEAISADGSVDLTGQLVTPSTLHIEQGAQLRYPSVAITLADSAGMPLSTPAWALERGARLEGLLLQPKPSAAAPPAVLERGSIVRGGILSQAPIDVRGRVEGTLATTALTASVPPRRYANWLVAGTLDRPARPAEMGVPFGFAEAGPPVVLEQAIRTLNSDERQDRALSVSPTRAQNE